MIKVKSEQPHKSKNPSKHPEFRKAYPEPVMIEVPREILWDYETAPEDIGWRLQRIADFFPLYGKDPATITLLYEHRDRLKLDRATLALIEAYHELLQDKDK